jgi:ATP-dependent Clp protease ATP-binding subunit ClpC
MPIGCLTCTMSIPFSNPDRFTDRAVGVFGRAEHHAIKCGFDAVSTEGLLLALLAGERGPGLLVLQRLGVSLSNLHTELIALERSSSPEVVAGTKVPFLAVTALAFAKEEAVALRHDYVGTEHLVLGLLRLQDSPAARVLRNHGVSLEAFREEVVGLYASQRFLPEAVCALTGTLAWTARRSCAEAIQPARCSAS